MPFCLSDAHCPQVVIVGIKLLSDRDLRRGAYTGEDVEERGSTSVDEKEDPDLVEEKNEKNEDVSVAELPEQGKAYAA